VHSVSPSLLQAGHEPARLVRGSHTGTEGNRICSNFADVHEEPCMESKDVLNLLRYSSSVNELYIAELNIRCY
jgi:hypothetical protein